MKTPNRFDPVVMQKYGLLYTMSWVHLAHCLSLGCSWHLHELKLLIHNIQYGFTNASMLYACFIPCFIPPSHLIRISRNQAEPARMEEFPKFVPHSRGNFNSTKSSYRFVRMPFEYLALQCSSNVVGTQ